MLLLKIKGDLAKNQKKTYVGEQNYIILKAPCQTCNNGFLVSFILLTFTECLICLDFNVFEVSH